MRRPILLLTLCLGCGWGLIEIASIVCGYDNRKVTLLACLSSWWPSVWSIMLIDRTRKTAPIIQIGVAISISFIRLIFTVVTGALGWYLISDLQERALELMVWGVVFYVLALVVSTRLIYQMVTPLGLNGEGLSA